MKGKPATVWVAGVKFGKFEVIETKCVIGTKMFGFERDNPAAKLLSYRVRVPRTPDVPIHSTREGAIGILLKNLRQEREELSKKLDFVSGEIQSVLELKDSQPQPD